MRILQVIPELDAGGAERTTLEVAEAIIAAGGEALVVSEGGRLVEELDGLGAEFIRLPVKTKNPLSLMANARALTNICRTRAVDIIHARSRAPAWSALWAARACRIPFVTTYHGAYGGRSALKRLYNSVMARGDRVIANSGFIAEHVAATHHVEAKRLRVIARGVDLDRFDPDAMDASSIKALRHGWGAMKSDRVILLPGRLTAWKGQTLAIEAVGALKRSDLVLVCAGDEQGRSQYRESLRQLAARLGVRLVLPGHVTDVPAAMAAADIVMAPSVEPEAFGRTAAEAMAMARPVIAAAHGGALEVIDPGRTGWLVRPGDPAALGEALLDALSADAEMLQDMGERSRLRVIERFSKAALQASTLRVYRELLE
ncbi:MAG: glycosyltransferase family 4 protein [Pseudomonadota bacterium]